MIIRVSQRLCFFFCCKDTFIYFSFGAISIILGVKTDISVFKGSYYYLILAKFRYLFMSTEIFVCILYVAAGMFFFIFCFPPPGIEGREIGVSFF